MPLTKAELSAIRAKAGSKGGKAPHKKRGLQAAKLKTRRRVSRAGNTAKWRPDEA